MAKKFMFLLRVANYLHNGKPKAAVAGAPELAKHGSQIHGSARHRSTTTCKPHALSSTGILKVNALEESTITMEVMNFTKHVAIYSLLYPEQYHS